MAEAAVEMTAEAVPAQKRERRPADARRQAILQAAVEVFLERGYADATVDAVVDKAGGSKATVYAMFGNKEGLFAAVAADCAERFAASIGAVPVCESLETSLRRIARAYLDIVLHPTKLAMFRMISGDCGRLPEVGDVFYRLGPEAATRAVGKFLRDCAARHGGELADADALAGYFLGALRGSLFNRVLLNPTRAPTSREIDDHVAAVVALFLPSYKAALAKRAAAEA